MNNPVIVDKDIDKEVRIGGIGIEKTKRNDILIYLGNQYTIALSNETAKWLIQTVEKYLD